tara:strand:- start:332 stop:535 length:204 start_codon:yes stop_codon:yes gene_type:complete
MTPVELCISHFGGLRQLAKAIHRDPAAVSRWKSTHGCIPHTVQKKLLQAAWDRGINISAHDIIFAKE